MNFTSRIIIVCSLNIITISCGNNEGTILVNETENDSIVTEIVTPTNISEDVDAAKFKELIESGKGLLMDVRTHEEFAKGNIQGAVNIDFNGEKFNQSIDSLDKENPVYVYCQAGGRSGKTKDILLEKGFKEVYNLTGGFGSWPY